MDSDYDQLSLNSQQFSNLIQIDDSMPQQPLQAFNGQQQQVVGGEIILKIYKCNHCTIEFDNYQAKGGHTAKSHPNQSEEYASRIALQKQRQHIVYLNKQLRAIAIQALQE